MSFNSHTIGCVLLIWSRHQSSYPPNLVKQWIWCKCSLTTHQTAGTTTLLTTWEVKSLLQFKYQGPHQILEQRKTTRGLPEHGRGQLPLTQALKTSMNRMTENLHKHIAHLNVSVLFSTSLGLHEFVKNISLTTYLIIQYIVWFVCYC